MSTVAMSGNDAISINNTILTDLADGDCVVLSFPNEIASVKIGKNGNAIYGLNTTGQMSEVKIRVIRGSADDKLLNNLLTQQQLNFSGFTLMIGEFVKLVGDGKGNVQNDTYIMSGGVFSKAVEAKTNVEGDALQSVSEYMIRFANNPAIRAIT